MRSQSQIERWFRPPIRVDSHQLIYQVLRELMMESTFNSHPEPGRSIADDVEVLRFQGS